ncbi:MAG: DUF1553 domain-containing protein [Opitutus sp.]|nr:DUF1553 domain-containing protein [Opitutus sp.]
MPRNFLSARRPLPILSGQQSLWSLFARGAVGLLLGGVGPALAVDYVKDVKPLLAATCYKCHGATQQKGGLRVDTAAFMFEGGDTGPSLKRGASGASLLLKVVRGEHEEIARMPYKKPPLTQAQIALLATWIDEGAAAPANEEPGSSRHWAFVPPSRPAVPKIDKSQFEIRHPIDAFIRARLQRENLQPSPEADRVTLIRRLSLDLVGLPPTIAEVDAFVQDRSPGAYEQLVDRLLASPHYGERWGRWWLDAARYADSNGYSIDAPRQIWKYRDWVIDALNRDLPFDQFTIEQIAGDMLPGATLAQKVATGFHRNTQINQEGGIDKEQFRLDSIIDRVSTTGTVWLGLTVGCTQCHDHKFDPLLQREFYGLLAFFNNADEPELSLATPEEAKAIAEADARTAAYYEALKAGDPAVWERMLAWERSLTPEQRQRQSESVRGSFDRAFEKRSADQKQLVLTAFIEQAAENEAHQTELNKIRAVRPSVPSAMVISERDQPRRSYLFMKGDFTRDGGEVEPMVPAVLHPLKREPAGATGDRPNRLDLARWLVDPANPLTARVTVNRVWQQYFGRGIVETENDFGTQGLPPTHPELLDWLATEFVERGWSLKALHRQIVTSATYRQSSLARRELSEVDAGNRLFARQSRLRLEAEIVRDVALAASGLLNPRIGGPGVFPPQPEGVYAFTQIKREWKPDTGGDRHRRGMYTFFFRAAAHPALNVFDAPDAYAACTRRLRSNTPLQALTLLNDQAFHECAEGLARRVLSEGPPGEADRLEYAFRLGLSRRPEAEEARALRDLLHRRLASSGETHPLAAWTAVARVVLNLDEMITRE